MALFDKLKGFADKAKETAKDVAGVTKGIATSVANDLSKRGNSPEAQAAREEAKRAEHERIKAEMEAEKQRLEDLKSRVVEAYMRSSMDEYEELKEEYEDLASEDAFIELKKLIEKKEIEKCENIIAELAQKTECDLGKGDCGWLGHSFYCTCSSDAECPRKKYVPETEQGKLISTEHLPYIKFISSFYSDSDLKMVDSDTGIRFFVAFRQFFAKFLPEHLPATWGDSGMALASFMLANGMGAENIVMDILFSIHEQTGGKVVPPVDFLIDVLHDIVANEDENEYMNIALPFFKNPSLYDRSREDLEYTAKILDIVSSPSKRAAASMTSDEVSLEKLFNEDGTIKEAGIGGPRKGFYGDVIYNIVGSWTV